jgi:protein tyrosine phosphatase (PTP) superfamily phosphohydrolase (DUF442 family)
MQTSRTFCILLACAVAGGGDLAMRALIAEDQLHQPTRVSATYLPNAYQLHPKVISGGLPDGDAAFEELANLGVKTIISVDGATPDVETAKKHGLRYVHLPHGYDGIPQSRAKELAKAVRDLPGPIYIHCHHGKHRSPAAAVVACVAAGFVDPVNAELILRTAGTSESYRGLYQSALSARRADARLLDAIATDYPDRAAIPPLAEAMVALEHTHDHLKQIAAAGWKAPPSHPDLEPAHEALMLGEHFKELLRLDSVRQEPVEFQRYLTESQTAAEQLENDLRKMSPTEKLVASFQRISDRCADCHRRFRDVPISEKRK